MGTVSRVMGRADDPVQISDKTVPRTTEESPRTRNCGCAASLPCCEVTFLTFHINSPCLLDAS